MAFVTVFKRYELKFLLTNGQKEKILRAMEPYMELDKYGLTTIRNIYLDTENYRLIRRSIEKPTYKEKLRIRSYSRANKNDLVFVELKKKYQSVVYKRRLAMTSEDALNWLARKKEMPTDTQIAREIDYFANFYGKLQPTVFLSYEREAYFDKGGSDFRVTFDKNILCRTSDIDLSSDIYGSPILQDGKALMEIKCSGGIPLWMAEALTHERIFKTSFSKYGTAYEELIFPSISAKQKEIILNGCNI